VLTRLLFFAYGAASIVVAIQFEERDLVFEHGAAYEEYRRRVPMLLPGRRRLRTTWPAVTGRKGEPAQDSYVVGR